jgi:hypothetical protein
MFGCANSRELFLGSTGQRQIAIAWWDRRCAPRASTGRGMGAVIGANCRICEENAVTAADRWGFVVVLAVSSEPLSEFEFPANREFNREFSTI